MARQITYSQAIKEAITQCMEKDKRVFIIGEGVPDPKGIFGTTLGLQEKFGSHRVMDMPVSENAITGACLGAALRGLRPIMTHQRVDFSLYAFDQIVNAVSKWYYMFGGKTPVPLVIRMIIGRGWGQGSQHSQSLQSLYAHIPGLKVVMPSTPYDAKGMLIAAVEDNNPVIFLEHRWLHNISDSVPKRYYKAPIKGPTLIREGCDVTLVTVSYMTVEGLRAIDVLKKEGIETELIDLRVLRPLNLDLIFKSVKKTGRLVVADTGWKTLSIASEIITRVCESAFNCLKVKPVRIALPDISTPTSWTIAEKYYPTAVEIIESVMRMMEVSEKKVKQAIIEFEESRNIKSDVPDSSFKGPF